MPAWGDILEEINACKGNCDMVRRKYLARLAELTQRPVILYASKWTQGGNSPPSLVTVNSEDLQGLMTVVNGIAGQKIDIILHSPGGSIDAAEALVTYLRTKFDSIRVIVPQQAMSAATMIACAADEIVMGKHSFLGPTDPQFILSTQLGARMVAAQDIVDQFSKAQKECSDPSKLAAWIPILSQYGPDLIVASSNMLAHCTELVGEWLLKYMFRGEQSKVAAATDLAGWLNSHQETRTHGRSLSRDILRGKGFTNIVDLEGDQAVQDAVLSVFHATTITFDQGLAVKIWENHLGKAFIKLHTVGPVLIPKRSPIGVEAEQV